MKTAYKAIDKSQINELVEMMGTQKKRCLSELFMTEEELRSMDNEQYRCAAQNVIEWMNDFYGIRK